MRGKSVVILTGAGISAESGVRTFRDNDGLWENHRIEDVATPLAWYNDPVMVWRFYQARRNQMQEVEPNPAHLAIAEFQKEHGNVILITQNVDNLHERGGSESVIHMHGKLETLRCELSEESYVCMNPEHLSQDFVDCNCCAEASRMRPDIVWFGEMPMFMREIYEAVDNCDVFIVVGSSGHVYPAAGLVDVASQMGARTILVNLEEPVNAESFDEVHTGKAGEILPGLVKTWLDED